MAFTNDEIAQIIEEFFNTVGARQYVGARYVPIFGRKGETSIEWDGGLAPYEPLTIVLHDGNSYTSRQFVPIGIDITDTAFWAETGNYNAQVEAYRNDVLRLSESVSELETTIEETVEELEEYVVDSIEKSRIGFEVGWISDTTGTCVVCKGDTGVICLDVGSADGNAALFSQQLGEFLGEQKIDVIVISHYHDDHSTGYEVVKQYAKDGCIVYEQMNPTINNTQYDQYVTNRNAIINAFGAANVKVPTNNQVINVGDLKLRIVNTDATNIPAYNSVNGESTRNANGLNVYSLISFVSKNGNTLCFTGDCEGITERLMEQYVEPCSIVSTPHHALNYLGYSEFFDKCTPKAWLYTKRNTILYNAMNIASFTDRFCGRYSVAENLPMLNGDSKAIFELSNNDIILKHGAFLSAADGTKGYAYSPMEMLGCTYYNDEPYSLLAMTGNEFLDNCRNYNPKQSCTFSGEYQIFEETPQFITDIVEYLGASTTETLRITPFGSALIIGNPNVLNNSKMAMMAGSANLSEESTTIVRINGISTPKRYVELSEGVTSLTITDDIIKRLLQYGNDNLYVEVATTSDISVRYRVYLKPINSQYREYRGIASDRNLTRLFNVAIVDNVVTGKIYSITNDTTTDAYIGAYGVGI